jgi:hypothetical protein
MPFFIHWRMVCTNPMYLHENKTHLKSLHATLNYLLAFRVSYRRRDFLQGTKHSRGVLCGAASELLRPVPRLAL